jgi:hypothetical protein
MNAKDTSRMVPKSQERPVPRLDLTMSGGQKNLGFWPPEAQKRLNAAFPGDPTLAKSPASHGFPPPSTPRPHFRLRLPASTPRCLVCRMGIGFPNRTDMSHKAFGCQESYILDTKALASGMDTRTWPWLRKSSLGHGHGHEPVPWS